MKKKYVARGISVKLKLKNFQVLQHSKSFKQPLETKNDLENVLQLLLHEMHIPAQDQFRLIGIGLYQLSPADEQVQLSLLLKYHEY